MDGSSVKERCYIFLHLFKWTMKIISSIWPPICSDEELLEIPSDVVDFDWRPVKLLDFSNEGIVGRQTLLQIGEERFLIHPIDFNFTENGELWDEASTWSHTPQYVHGLMVLLRCL